MTMVTLAQRPNVTNDNSQMFCCKFTLNAKKATVKNNHNKKFVNLRSDLIRPEICH